MNLKKPYKELKVCKKIWSFLYDSRAFVVIFIDDQDVRKILLACSIDDKALKKNLKVLLKKS